MPIKDAIVSARVDGRLKRDSVDILRHLGISQTKAISMFYSQIVQLPQVKFLREASIANVQGLQAVQHHELEGPVGRFNEAVLARLREALRFAMDL